MPLGNTFKETKFPDVQLTLEDFEMVDSVRFGIRFRNSVKTRFYEVLIIAMQKYCRPLRPVHDCTAAMQAVFAEQSAKTSLNIGPEGLRLRHPYHYKVQVKIGFGLGNLGNSVLLRFGLGFTSVLTSDSVRTMRLSGPC